MQWAEQYMCSLQHAPQVKVSGVPRTYHMQYRYARTPIRQVAMEDIPVAMLWVDWYGRICLANRAAASMLHWQEGVQWSSYLSMLQGKERNDFSQSLHIALRKGNVAEIHHTLHVKKAQSLPVVVHISPFQYSNQGLCLLTLYRDRGMEESRALKMRMALTHVCHDLGNYLQNMRGCVQSLEYSLTDEAMAMNNVASFNRNVNAAQRLINNVMDTTRLDGDSYTPFNRVVQVGSVLQEAVKNTQAYADTCKLSVIMDISQEPLCVRCDPTHLERVTLNLLNNAFKFTPPGKQIVVQSNACLYQGKPHVHISVADQGCGIEKDRLKYVFKAFQARTGQAGEGSGIGLSLVKLMVKWMKGHIKVSSQVDLGTRFDIYLPLAEQSAAEAERPLIRDLGAYSANVLIEMSSIEL